MRPPLRVQFSPGRTGDGTLDSSTTTGPPLTFRKSIEASTVMETKTKVLDPEVYWAHAIAWQRLTQASDYANQAGFAFVINAANNRWGGRHPPHTTHENGFDFDLDVAIPGVPGNAEALVLGRLNQDFRIIANLAEIRKVLDKRGPFVDEMGDRFKMQPLLGQSPNSPTSQTLLDRLAIWVALQALQLVGMNDVLYGDLENMDLSARHMAGRLQGFSPGQPVTTPDQQPEKKRKKKLPPLGQPRQLLEPVAHYNHLHAELPRDLTASLDAPPKFTGETTWTALNDKLREWALVRDNDDRFLELMFGPPRQHAATTTEMAYREYWLARSSKQEPSLLPIWDPSLKT